MTKVETSVLIEAPLESVYAYASDWRNFTRYFVYVRDVQPLTEKTLGEGAQLALRVKFRGLALKSEWRGVDETKNVSWTFKAKLMGRWATKRFSVAAANGFTKFVYTMEYEPPPLPPGRLLDALFIRPEWERLNKRSCEMLKERVEADVSAAGRAAASERSASRETRAVG